MDDDILFFFCFVIIIIIVCRIGEWGCNRACWGKDGSNFPDRAACNSTAARAKCSIMAVSTSIFDGNCNNVAFDCVGGGGVAVAGGGGGDIAMTLSLLLLFFSCGIVLVVVLVDVVDGCDRGCGNAVAVMDIRGRFRIFG